MPIRPTFLFATLLLLPACQSAPTGFTEADQSSIRALDAAFVKMAMAADWANLVRHYYAPDAVVLAPNEPAVTGHAQIEASFRNWPPIKSMTLQCEDLGGSGDFAYTRSSYVMTITAPGASVTDQGKCLCIYRRQSDGSWKASQDTWNTDLPLPAPTTK